jgi:glyoxylase-like metal-dependent hydrolase (beta-lactamase superfamily II)
VADLLELTPHVFLLKLFNATASNIYIVREPDGDTLVDPGPVGTAQIILALDRHRELRLRRLVLTHAHPAHAGSAARVARGTGVRVWVHPADAQFLDGRAPPLLPRGRRGQLVAALGRVVDLMPPLFGLEPLLPDSPVGELVAIPTPGHTPGHVCLLHRSDRALLTGDALVVSGGVPALPASSTSQDPARARSSLASLRGVDYVHLFPGHGAPLLGNARALVDRFLS